jgi:hypothetical protein
MTPGEVLVWLESELSEFPERAAGEELYEFLVCRTESLSRTDRTALIRALASWLILRSEPRTMLAVEIAAAHRLSELRGEIQSLLSDVQQGRAFGPHYATPIGSALGKL